MSKVLLIGGTADGQTMEDPELSMIEAMGAERKRDIYRREEFRAGGETFVIYAAGLNPSQIMRRLINGYQARVGETFVIYAAGLNPSQIMRRLINGYQARVGEYVIERSQGHEWEPAVTFVAGSPWRGDRSVNDETMREELGRYRKAYPEYMVRVRCPSGGFLPE